MVPLQEYRVQACVPLAYSPRPERRPRFVRIAGQKNNPDRMHLPPAACAYPSDEAAEQERLVLRVSLRSKAHKHGQHSAK